jgi:hypothetical protein
MHVSFSFFWSTAKKPEMKLGWLLTHPWWFMVVCETLALPGVRRLKTLTHTKIILFLG